MITTFYPPYNFGGDGIYVQRLANALGERGHRVDVVHCRDAYLALAQSAPSVDYRDHPNVTVHGLRSGVGMLAPLAAQQLGLPLFKTAALRLILQNDFDVIHFHNVSLIGGPALLRYGRALKLYTIHEYWLVCPTHTLFKYNREVCRAPRCVSCTLRYRRPPQWWRYFGLLERAARSVDAFIAPSRFAKRLHQGMNWPVRFEHIANFAPPMPRPGATVREPGAEPYFLYVGRLEKLKGVQTLIPIFQRFEGAVLWIAGTGAQEAKLRRQAAGSTNIRFMGQVDSDHLAALYRGAVAVIVPSLCFEVFPTVAIEALAAGTPVLVRNLGAMPEVVEDSDAGFIYNTDAELIDAMNQILDNQILREDLSRRAQTAYQRHWTPEIHLQRYFQLIENLQNRRGPK